MFRDSVSGIEMIDQTPNDASERIKKERDILRPDEWKIWDKCDNKSDRFFKQCIRSEKSGVCMQEAKEEYDKCIYNKITSKKIKPLI